MVAISVALQKAVELQERSLVLKEAHIILYTDSRSTIQKLAKATGKEEIVHQVLSLAGGNAHDISVDPWSLRDRGKHAG